MITEIETQDKITIDRTLKDELTKDLSPDDLSKIKKGFDLYKGVVNLQQFIIIMLQSLYNKTEFHKRKL
jgi:hypothetical protein